MGSHYFIHNNKKHNPCLDKLTQKYMLSLTVSIQNESCDNQEGSNTWPGIVDLDRGG